MSGKSRASSSAQTLDLIFTAFSAAALASTTSPPGTNVQRANTTNIKNQLSYLVKGEGSALQGATFKTRSLLRTTRYVLKFLFWRLVRYGKYALVGAAAAALAGTFAGTALPVAATLIVPSVPVAAAIGLTTAAIKFGWRHRGNHFRQGWAVGGAGRDARADERGDAEEAAKEFERPVVHPRATDAWSKEGFA